jgi:hypothetical protein
MHAKLAAKQVAAAAAGAGAGGGGLVRRLYVAFTYSMMWWRQLRPPAAEARAAR